MSDLDTLADDAMDDAVQQHAIPRLIARHMRRHAPDVTYADIAVSLGVPERDVRAWTRHIKPEVSSKVTESRRIIGLLASRLYEATGETWEEIAEKAGTSRQHLHKCREEANRYG
jgi:predicted transcriptional regulator